MTPAINLLKKNKIKFNTLKYKHDPNCEAYGEEAFKALNLNPKQVFKTLLIKETGSKNNFFTCIVSVENMLNLKKAAKACEIKKAEMTSPQEAEKSTGYLVGGISPLGQKKRLTTILDESALNFSTIFVSAGRRGLEVELDPNDLVKLCNGSFADIKD